MIVPVLEAECKRAILGTKRIGSVLGCDFVAEDDPCPVVGQGQSIHTGKKNLHTAVDQRDQTQPNLDPRGLLPPVLLFQSGDDAAAVAPAAAKLYFARAFGRETRGCFDNAFRWLLSGHENSIHSQRAIDSLADVDVVVVVAAHITIIFSRIDKDLESMAVRADTVYETAHAVLLGIK